MSSILLAKEIKILKKTSEHLSGFPVGYISGGLPVGYMFEGVLQLRSFFDSCVHLLKDSLNFNFKCP